jgi:hypothetical protein
MVVGLQQVAKSGFGWPALLAGVVAVTSLSLLLHFERRDRRRCSTCRFSKSACSPPDC